MTLSVNVFQTNEAGAMMAIVEPDSHPEELAGFESWRKTVYGSRASQSLGLRILPGLATGDVYTTGSELERLGDEIELTLSNLRLFAEESGADAETLRFRLENIKQAVRKAIRIRGGVVIW
jgi:hypothetical protein